ncbi:MAG: prolyl oligopeptidase family serine peptidase, partial [Marinilabiliales bacterium]|nr:prolyl oligopeptidase family serine peptidase [Marinilabiliales bacterium]
MKNCFALLILFLLAGTLGSNAQTAAKKPLTHDVYDTWKELAKPAISTDGRFATFEINPQKGDGCLHLEDLTSGKKDSVARGGEALFSSSADLLVYRIKQPEAALRKLRMAKTKKEDMPKDTLAYRILSKSETVKSGGLKSFQMPKEGGAWIAWLQDMPKEKEKTKGEGKDSLRSKMSKDTTALKGKGDLKKDKKAKKGAFSETETSRLILTNPVTGSKFSFDNVTEASFSKNGALCAFVTLKKDTVDSTAVHVFDTRSTTDKKIFSSDGLAKKVFADNAGKQVGYLFTRDTAKVKRYSLQLWDEKSGKAQLIADTTSVGIPNRWEVSENGRLSFSDDGTKLFFGTAPKVMPQPKDTLADDEKFRLDIWNYKDTRLQPQQLKEMEEDLKQNFQALYRIPEKKIIQLADTVLTRVRTIKKGNGEVALGSDETPYELASSWEESAFRDLYLIDLKTGTRKLILKKSGYAAELSPEGNYLGYYDPEQKNWFVMDLVKFQKRNLTGSLPVAFWNEKHDTPSAPESYGSAGWLEGDESFFVYDQYDLWQLDPKGIKPPVNLTANGRSSRTSYRFVQLDPEALSIKKGEPLLLKTVEEESCHQGFATMTLDKPGQLNPLVRAGCEFTLPVKAKNSDRLLWQQSTYTRYPDLWASKGDFTGAVRLSNANPQMSQYLWGTVEQVKWTTLEGKTMKGLLYKPENLDPSKKYPLIVYYYERYSDKYFTHYVPSPSRSTVNFPYYNSNGYLVFVPDITYTTGHPGKDAYNSIMSGTLELMKRPYVDAANMGLQGQSWGGYQTAFMVTQTSLFKAAMAGAPVSNMTSAYGGIRWE